MFVYVAQKRRALLKLLPFDTTWSQTFVYLLVTESASTFGFTL